jgi:hypothetical protein
LLSSRQVASCDAAAARRLFIWLEPGTYLAKARVRMKRISPANDESEVYGTTAA